MNEKNTESSVDTGTLDVVIQDSKGLPIPDFEFQIIIGGKTVFSGKTDANGNGKIVEGLKLGSVFEVHVKTDKGDLKKVATGTINSATCKACLQSPKTRIVVKSEIDKGDAGKAAEHKEKVINSKQKGAESSNSIKPHTVEVARNAKGKPVVLVTNGAKVAGGVSGATKGVNKDIVDYIQAVGEYYDAAIVVTSGLRDKKEQPRILFEKWTKLKRGAVYSEKHLPKAARKLMDEQYIIAMETPKATEAEKAAAKSKFLELGAAVAQSYHFEGRAVDIRRSTLPAKAKEALDLELKLVDEPDNPTIWHFQKETGAVPQVTEIMKSKWQKP